MRNAGWCTQICGLWGGIGWYNWLVYSVYLAHYGELLQAFNTKADI
jgi:hypothetical protein